MIARVFGIVATIIVFVIIAGLSLPAPSFAQLPTNRSHIIGGYVVATVLTQRERVKRIRFAGCGRLRLSHHRS